MPAPPGVVCNDDDCDRCDPSRGFEASSSLRAEGDTNDDPMGADYDPMQVGVAEDWFRNLRGDK